MAFTKVAPAGIGSTPGDGYRIGDSFLHSTGVEITNINATGILTATSLDISGSIDVDGHTNLDNVSIAGVTTMGQTTIAHTGAPQLIIKDSDTSGAADSNGISFVDASNTQYGFIGQSGTSQTMFINLTNTINPIRLQINNSTKLEVGNVGVYVSNGNFYVNGGNNAYITGSIDINSNAPTLNFNDANGNPDYRLFVNAGVFSIVDTTNSVDRLRITSAGHLGVGDNNPDTRLSVTAASGTDVVGKFTSTDANAWIQFRDNSTTDTAVMVGASGDNLLLRAGSNERVRITSDGRLLIGATSGGNADTDDFIVSGSGKKGITVCSTNGSECRLTFADGLSGANAVAGNITYDHSVDRMDFYTATTRRVSITNNNHVGINTITPSTYLTISATGNQRQDMLKLQHQGQRTFYIQGQWGQRDIGDSNGVLQYTDGGGIAFRSGATGDAGMIVSQANKVGIHTNNPSVNLHAFMANTTNASLTWGANCGQIFRNEGSELAFGLQNTNPYPFYIQARTNASSARQLALNPAGGAVSVNTNNSFSRTFNVRGTIGVLSPSQITALDLNADDSQNTTISSYHASGSNLYLRTNYSGAGVQNRLHISGNGESSFYGTSSGNSIGITIRNQNTANYSHARLRLESQNNAKASDIYTDVPNDALRLQYNGSNSVFIKDTGRVGILTNTPGSALHVRGAGGIRIDPLANLPIDNNNTVVSDGLGNPYLSGSPWYMAHTYQWQGSYSGMGYYWIKVVKSLGNSAIGYIDYMAHGDSNYPRHCRGTIAIAKYANGSISCCHDQQTHEGGGNIQVKLCGDGTVWIRLHAYDWNSDFRFRLVYGEDVTLNTDFTVTGNSDNSYGRIDPRGGGHPVNASNEINPGANARYSVSANQFNPSGSNASYGNDDHRFFRINCMNQLTKGSGSFRIDHPLAGMSTSHYLQHSFVEGPQADNIYRGKTTLVAGISTVNIDTASNMTDGTFVELNTDVQCFTTNETGWTPIKGSVSGNKLTIFAQDNSCTDTISWMVVGERQDDHIKNKADWTDSDGKVIVELPKRNVGFAGTEAPYDEFK